MVRVNGQRHWLYAAVDPDTNQFLHVRLFQTRTTQLMLLFLREPREKQHLSDMTCLVDDAHHLTNALERLGLRFRVCRHGNRNAIERVFREVKRRTSLFSNTFSNAQLPAVESWLNAFAAWWNQCKANTRKLLLGVNLSKGRGTDPATEFLRQFIKKHDLSDTDFLVDGYGYLTALSRLDLSDYLDYVDQNLIEKWFHKLKIRIDRFHHLWVGSRAAVAQWLAQFTYYYNFQRPNRALNNRTPAEVVN